MFKVGDVVRMTWKDTWALYEITGRYDDRVDITLINRSTVSGWQDDGLNITIKYLVDDYRMCLAEDYKKAKTLDKELDEWLS